MKIGDKTYSTKRPADLDDQLIASNGCNSAEMVSLLSGSPLAGHVAQALLPFLAEKDRTSAPELASEIAAAGVQSVAAEVVKLYQADVPASTSAASAPGATA